MKKIFTLGLILMASQAVTAQSLEIRNGMGTVLNTDTVELAGLSTDTDIQAHGFNVYNVGSSTINVSCTRREVNVLTGTATALCWSVCSMDYGAGSMPVLTAPGGDQAITAGGYSDLFVLHYKPLNNVGTSLYKITFVNTDTPSDSAYFFIRFSATVSVPEISKNISIKAYPNPANQFITFDVDQFGDNTTLKIVDVLGSTVKTVAVNNLTTKVPVADLKEGIYFYSLTDKNKTIATRRFVVSR